MEEMSADAEEAAAFATIILESMMKKDFEPFIAQAALGDAWFRLCFALEISADTFEEMSLELVRSYRQQENDL